MEADGGWFHHQGQAGRHVFVTNTPTHTIMGDLVGSSGCVGGVGGRARCGCYEEIQPKMTNYHESALVLLTFFSFLLYNIWVVVGLLGGGVDQAIYKAQPPPHQSPYSLTSLTGRL